MHFDLWLFSVKADVKVPNLSLIQVHYDEMMQVQLKGLLSCSYKDVSSLFCLAFVAPETLILLISVSLDKNNLGADPSFDYSV